LSRGTFNILLSEGVVVNRIGWIGWNAGCNGGSCTWDWVYRRAVIK
jgi:hypothetical protein